MKRALVVSITAFYLLLTIGTHICVVYYSAKAIVEKMAMQMACNHNEIQYQNTSKHKPADFFKKHTNYTAEENSKTDFGSLAVASVITVNHFHFSNLNYQPLQTGIFSAYSNAPPAKSGKDMAIHYRSLII